VYEEFPTGRYDGEEVSYNDWLPPFNDNAPPNFPEADHEAPLPFVNVEPPTSGTLKLLDESNDQYAARPVRVVPVGGTAETDCANGVMTSDAPRRKKEARSHDALRRTFLALI
jgi:hypothetical protein